MNTPTANDRKSRKGHKGMGGRPRGSKDRAPRLNASMRAALRAFAEENGDLVVDALERALQSAAEEGQARVSHDIGGTGSVEVGVLRLSLTSLIVYIPPKYDLVNEFLAPQVAWAIRSERGAAEAFAPDRNGAGSRDVSPLGP